MKSVGELGTLEFTDVPENYPGFGYINQIWREGITSGCATNQYCPTSSLTRRQMARFISQTFDLLHPQNGHFEYPHVGRLSFKDQPSHALAGWTFGTFTGVTGKNSAFTAANQLTGSGQVAYVTNNGQISRTSSNVAPGQYVVTLRAAQRVSNPNGTQSLSIWVDNVLRGTITPPPSSSQLASYSTPAFSIPAGGSKPIIVAGTGTAGGPGNPDFTAFVDDVILNKVDDILSPQNVGDPCLASEAARIVDGEPTPPGWVRLLVRHMGSGAVTQDPLFDAFLYTNLPRSTACDRARNIGAANVPQSIFQLLGTFAGQLVLSSDAGICPVFGSFKCPNTMLGADWMTGGAIGKQLGDVVLKNPDDSIEFEAKARMVMANPTYPIGTQRPPVGQLYVGMTFQQYRDDIPQARYVQASVLFYDTRPSWISRCDLISGPDTTADSIIMQMQMDGEVTNCAGFSAMPANAFPAARPFPTFPASKYASLEMGSSTLVFGGGLPNYGAWPNELRSFKVRLTAAAMRAALLDARTGRPSFAGYELPSAANPKVEYRLISAGIFQESHVFHQTQNPDGTWQNSPAGAIDMSSSFGDLRIRRLIGH